MATIRENREALAMLIWFPEFEDPVPESITTSWSSWTALQLEVRIQPVKTDKDMWVKYTFFTWTCSQSCTQECKSNLALSLPQCFDMLWRGPPDKSQQLGDSAHHTTVAATPAIWHRIMSRAIYILPQRCQDMPKTPNGKGLLSFRRLCFMRCPFLGSNFRQSADVPRCLGSGTGDQAKSPSTHRRGGFEIFQ